MAKKESKAHKKSAASKAKRKEAVPSLTGRPAMFQTPEEMQDRINAYFNICKPTFLTINGKRVLDKNGNPVIDTNPPTITGLAYFLGFESRQSFYDYAEKERFSYIIARARTRMEAERERDLCAGRNVDGNKFYLANRHNWKAEQESKHDVSISARSFNVNEFLAKFNAEK